MKAAVYTRYGPPEVVEIRDIEQPVPKDHEVLIQVRAASLNPSDWRLLKGVPHLFRILFRLPDPSVAKPGMLGHDVAGQVKAVAANVTRFKPGDNVFGVCHGAIAEYATSSENKLEPKPDNITFEQAAAVPVAAITALQGLRDHGRIGPGQRVLINGAAGGVGTFAVQIARSFGAHVTGVCSTPNVEMIRSLGADHVIDYTREDFVKSGLRFDLILDNVGNRSLSELRRVLNHGGRCIIAGAPKDAAIFFLTRSIAAPVISRLGSRKFKMFIAKIGSEDLAVMCELMRAGKVTPVIDKRYSMAETPEAIRYLESGHARAKVVVSLNHS